MPAADQIIAYGGSVHHRFAQNVLALVNTINKTALTFTHVWHSDFPDTDPGFELTEFEKIANRHILIFSCPIRPTLELELRDMVMASKFQYGAATVTVVMPFLRYRRQDRSENHFEIIRLRWFMKNLHDWGVDNLVLCEPHSLRNTQKYTDEFGLKLFVADPTRLFADALRGPIQAAGGPEKFRMYAPDFGSIGRALRQGNALGIRVLGSPKSRGPDGEVRLISDTSEFMRLVHENFGADAPVSCDLEEARGKILIMREDELDTAGTATSTMKNLKMHGAEHGWLVCTHQVCSPGWKRKLWPRGKDAPFSAIWFGNTRPRGLGTYYQGSSGGRVRNVPMEPVVAEKVIEVIAKLP